MRGALERGGGGAPPPRTPRTRRPLAVVVLVAAAAGATLLAASGRARPPAHREPPFDLTRPALDFGERALLLYVTPTCPWCRRELHAWDSLLAAAPPGTRPPTVVMAPGAPADWRSGLPPMLAGGAHLDADGSMGRALGVGAVPFRAHVTPPGRVVQVAAGLSNPAERDAILAFLNANLDNLPEVRR